MSIPHKSSISPYLKRRSNTALAQRISGLFCVACLAFSVACEDGATKDSHTDIGRDDVVEQNSNNNSQQSDGWCPSMTFQADLHGAPATAKLVFEPQYEMGYVSGTITSQSASYSFYGDTPIDVNTKLPTSSVMWVEVTAYNGERFRAEIGWYAEGFLFTPNPFGEGPLTSYEFYCQD